ncbi:MAG: holo-ACP synthase [Hydrotalea sp.]|nr:holo-ACP synthase [Hydrotalea sp.]
MSNKFLVALAKNTGQGIKPISHIVGTGIDLAQISRFEKTLQRFPKRFPEYVFTERERRYCDSKPIRRTARYAMLFSAKEACSKALGTGMRQGVLWQNMEVVHLMSGQPTMVLHGGALKRARSLMPKNATPVVHVSLTDEAGLAAASVMLGW